MTNSGNEYYAIEFDERAVKDMRLIKTHSILERIRKIIDKKLTLDPIRFGKPLSNSWRGFRRLRVEKYRIIYRIDEDNRTVIVRHIGH